MKKILFCLLSGTLFLFSSCQSDELTTNGDPTEGNTVTSGGKTVKFTYNNTLPNVRTYYNIDENGVSARWSDDDIIVILSPVSEVEYDSHQITAYTIANGGNASGSFVHTPIDETVPIVWNAYGTQQNFYAYYPLNAVFNYEDYETKGGISVIDLVTGEANFHVPYDQSEMAHIIPSASNSETNPLAYAVAAAKNVPIDEESSVQLVFHDFMNVLRVQVNNPFRKLVKGVKVSTVSNSTDLIIAGTVGVTFSSESQSYATNAQVSLDGGTFIIPSNTEIIAIEDEPSTAYELNYDLYLLPQQYPEGSLKVTVMMEDDDTEDIVKVIPSLFSKSNLKQVAVNVGPEYNIDNDYGIEMVDIPAGNFMLGGATDCYTAINPTPTYNVVLYAFQIAKHEFTQGQWDAVVKDAIKALKNNTGAAAALRAAGFSMDGNNLKKGSAIMTASDTWPGGTPNADIVGNRGAYYPMHCVSNEDIVNVFIPLLNALTNKTYTLPTEAQWEYAARGGDYVNDWAGARGGDGSLSTLSTADETELKKVAWYGNSDYSSAPTHPGDGVQRIQMVGLLRPNGYGLYDMTGNVAEWCKDHYDINSGPMQYPPNLILVNYYYADPRLASGRIVRGGDCTNTDIALVVNHRDGKDISSRHANTGFRLVIYDGPYNNGSTVSP